MNDSMKLLSLQKPDSLVRLGVDTKSQAIKKLERLDVNVVDNSFYWRHVEEAMMKKPINTHVVVSGYSNKTSGL